MSILNYVIPQKGHNSITARCHLVKCLESNSRQGTETPAPSVGFETANIDPRLIEPCPLTTMRPSPSRSGTEISVSSVRSVATNTDSCLTEVSTHTATNEGRSKGSKPRARAWVDISAKHATCASRKCGHSEEYGERQREKRRSGKLEASAIKPPPRRSKRLRAQWWGGGGFQ